MDGLSEGSGDQIRIRGYSLSEDLIGRRTFPEVMHLLAFGRLPNEPHARMLDALLVTLADHGLTPSAIAARLTYLGAPESLQGAVASGLLGAGTHYLGTMSQVASMLKAVVDDESASVEQHVDRLLSPGGRIPGYGHPVHKTRDPRVGALHRTETELGIDDPHMRMALAIEDELTKRKGVPVPLNAAGAIGAIVCDLQLPADFARGLALVARSAGLVAHILEEQVAPIGDIVWSEARTGAFQPERKPPE